ncbi:MAG: ABC transporter substrate-binding protein [Actinobacteria bacterium]|nr:ABC transporter substrate-binding protein [Actinomycetota bacterium]
MKRRREFNLFLILMLVLALAILAGCGGGGATTTTAAPGTETTAAGNESTASTGAPSGGDIPIGILTSYTGEMGAFGVPWFNAAKMAADEVNAAGGVLGKQIKLYTEDDRSSVEEGIKGARKLIGANGVVAIHGPISDILLAIWPIAKENKVMATSPAAGTTKLDETGGDYEFRTVPSDSFDGKVAALVLWENGYKEIGMIYENDEGRQSISAAVRKEFEALGGKIVVDVPFTPRQPTYSAELKKVASANPQAVWLGSGQESGAVLLKDAKQRGYNWKWMVSSDLAVPEMFDLVGKDTLEGVLTEMPSAETSTPEFQAWAKRFQELFNAEPTGGFQSNSYDAIIVMALAMEKGGAATGEAINQNYRDVSNPPGEKVFTFKDGVAALKAGKDIDYEGVSGPLDFDAHGNVTGSYVSMIGKDGKWTQLKFYPASTWEQ